MPASWHSARLHPASPTSQYGGFLGLLLILLAAVNSGCQVLGNADQNETVFRPPAATSIPGVAINSTPTTLPLPTQPLAAIPTATPACSNDLRYEEDLTIPDGALVTAGQTLDKRWLVANSGTCNWDRRYRLKLIAGPDLGAASDEALFPARSSTEATIQLLFTAPNEPGIYRSAWQAHTPNGEPFGDPIYIEITVGEP